jgi:hypothetical protein
MVLTIATIIKFVMASAAEAKLAALFIATCKMVPHQQTLIDMGWPQPQSPIQTDNSKAVGVTNKTIVPKQSKMMDMRLWWLRCWAHKINFDITGMQAQRIRLTTAPNTIPIYTMKPIALHMQVYGTSLVFSLNDNACFYIFSSNFTSI